MCRLWWTSLLAMINRNGSMVSPDVQTFCLFRWSQWASPRHVAVCLFPLHANYTSCINVTVYYLERRYFIGLVNPFVSVENFSSCRNFSVILVAVWNQAHSMDKGMQMHCIWATQSVLPPYQPLTQFVFAGKRNYQSGVTIVTRLFICACLLQCTWTHTQKRFSMEGYWSPW